MRATTKLAAMVVALLASACGTATAQTLKWAKAPWPGEALQAYPRAAHRDQDGIVQLSCNPTRKGVLEACSILSETPAGQGFGEAALSLAPKFQLSKESMKAVAGPVILPLRFSPPNAAPPWREPSFGSAGYRDLGLAGPYYPDRAARSGVEGEVLMDCKVMGSDTFDSCAIVSVAPQDMGFDDAARAMVRRGYLKPGPPPANVAPPADGVWRFRIPFELKRR